MNRCIFNCHRGRNLRSVSAKDGATEPEGPRETVSCVLIELDQYREPPRRAIFVSAQLYICSSFWWYVFVKSSCHLRMPRYAALKMHTQISQAYVPSLFSNQARLSSIPTASERVISANGCQMLTDSLRHKSNIQNYRSV